MSYQEIENAVLEMPVEDQLRLIDRVRKNPEVNAAEDQKLGESFLERENLADENGSWQEWDGVFEDLKARPRSQ